MEAKQTILTTDWRQNKNFYIELPPGSGLRQTEEIVLFTNALDLWYSIENHLKRAKVKKEEVGDEFQIKQQGLLATTMKYWYWLRLLIFFYKVE